MIADTVNLWRRVRRPLRKALSALPGFDRWRARLAARTCAATTEPELRLVRLLVPGRAFVDVGAHAGLYTMAALDCGAASIIALEPLPALAARLQRLLGRRGSVHAIALSACRGTRTLTVPTIHGRERLTRATLCAAAGGGRQIRVPTLSLDELALPRDAVVKIDVEGHELDVLAGGSGTLRAGIAAAWLIESEDRHAAGAPRRLIARLGGCRYRGWGVLGSRLIPAAAFDPAAHQSGPDALLIEAGGGRPASYISNFLFVREDVAEGFLALLHSAGFQLDQRA